ncbi:AAA family ATPase [Alteromonas gracilis]
MFDAEKVGETLMDVRPGLPPTDNFQHWDPWRPLVVETARRLLDYLGGTLVMPMTVLVEDYWREIHAGLTGHGIEVRHLVLHAERDELVRRIADDSPLPSDFRLAHVTPYADAAASWLHADAEVVDTTDVAPAEVAARIAALLDD